MNAKKRLLTAVTMLCMALILCTHAAAVDVQDPRFHDKTWDEIMEDFLAQHNTQPSQVTAAYYNTVTEEEHFLNPDQLMYGASVAKLPTNMLYAERVSKGEMSMDTLIRGNRYELLQRLSLVNSDNPAMETLVSDLGGGNYTEFRRQILPYIGVTEEEVDPSFLARNFFTAEQILYSLKLLYGNKDTYPGVEDCMLQASPYDYFKQNRPPYEIAHKYGWYTDNGTMYLNDSAIVYTDDPILLVMFTGNAPEARQVLADYCSLMCDYAQYTRVQRYLSESWEQTNLSLPTELEFLSVDKPSAVPSGYPTWQYTVVGIGCGVLILALVVLIWKKLAAFLLLLLALALIVVGAAPTEQAYAAVRDGTAITVLEQFEEAFSSDARGAYLTHYDAALPLSDGQEMSDIVRNKVADSFDLKIGKAERAGNYVAVPVTATKVDLEALNSDLQTLWEPELLALLQDVDPAELFDESGAFVPDKLDAAHAAAFDKLLSNWDHYLTTQQATLHLALQIENMELTWKIVADDQLLELCNYQ